MLITNHVLTGALVGALTPKSKAAFSVGVVSHFVCDALPHWGERLTHKEFMSVAVKDGLVGLSLMVSLTALTPSVRRKQVFFGMLGACLPDANKPGKVFFGRSPFPKAVDRFHARIQDEDPSRMPQEILLGALGVLGSAVVLTRAHRLHQRT